MTISVYIPIQQKQVFDLYHLFISVTSEVFMRILFLQNFAHEKFCEDKTIAKWQNHWSFIDAGKSCPSPKFLMWQICFHYQFPKIKLSQKISEFTVSLKDRIILDCPPPSIQ